MFKEHRFFRGPRRERRFRKGNLKYVILDLINDKPRSGYDIILALEERSHGFYTPSSGAIYPALQMLQDMGYVTSEEQDGRKIYTITDEGRNFLAKREDLTAGIKSRMKDWWNPDDLKEINQTWSEFGRLAQLMSRQYRGAGSEKMVRTRDAITEAYNKIEAILRD